MGLDTLLEAKTHVKYVIHRDALYSNALHVLDCLPLPTYDVAPNNAIVVSVVSPPVFW